MRHKRYIKMALELAKQSDVPEYKHGVIVVGGGGRILAKSFNKNKTMGLKSKYHEHYRKAHAEVLAVSQLKPEQLEGATMYVGGLSEAGSILFSCPCPNCQSLLRQFNLKAVYYHDKNGEPQQLVI